MELTFLLLSFLKDIAYISDKSSFDNMDSEQFDKLSYKLSELKYSDSTIDLKKSHKNQSKLG